ncbi:taste receptor type 2 member 14-like [Protopterus annectens]|uniref:taste receptor type 2 member 14-like n=1 Tax=Protopterus annectens TaxID=7888 RepID=UPI001CFB2BA8|nr:taste receptor type 2 member 14-like [Protopterus annectens]
MDLPSTVLEGIIFIVLSVIGLLGNGILIHFTMKSFVGRVRASCAVLFCLGVVHMLRILVVNILSVIYSVGGVRIFDSAGCKIFKFTSAVTTTISIWLTLYLASFYYLKLSHVVHPLSVTPTVSWRNRHLLGLFSLCVAGLAVYIPILVYSEKVNDSFLANITSSQKHASLVYAACQVRYTSHKLELIYGTVLLLSFDLVPLADFVIISIRIALLLWQHHKASYGDIWIGADKTETEVFRASKLSVLLMGLAACLWISHFILYHYQSELSSCYFIPAILAVLSCSYSSLSPYILIIVNYKVREKLKDLCCWHSMRQAKTQAVTVSASPYSE